MEKKNRSVYGFGKGKERSKIMASNKSTKNDNGRYSWKRWETNADDGDIGKRNDVFFLMTVFISKASIQGI